MPFATVHEGPRLVIGLASALLGAAALTLGIKRKPLPPKANALLGAGAAALALLALPLLPVGPALREKLQPGVAPVVNEALAIAQVSTAPLALWPEGARASLGAAAAALLLSAGAAAVYRNRTRALRLCAVLVGSGAGTVLLAWLHRWTGAERVFWRTEVPAYQITDFFAPFVNPNHGGALCAALLPLGLVLSSRGHARPAWGVASALLAAGVWTSGSRGAVAAALAGLILLGFSSGRRGPRAASGLALLGSGGLVAIVGPELLARWASAKVAPDATFPDLTGQRTDIWASTADIVGAAPYLGVGGGGFADAYEIFCTVPTYSRTDHAHQDYLQALAEHGVPGGGLWLILWLSPALLALHRVQDLEPGRRRDLLAGALGAWGALSLTALVDFPARIGALATLAALLAGLLVGMSTRKEEPSRRGRAPARLAAALFCVSSLSGALWAALEPGADDAQEEGDALREAGDAEGAEQRWRQALARRPLQASTLLRLARSRAEADDADGAAALLQLASEIAPTNPWIWLGIARAHDFRGEIYEAWGAYNRLLSLNLPDDDEDQAWVTEALACGGRPYLASDYAIPDRPDRLKSAASVLASHGRRRAAEVLYERAVDLDPLSAMAWGAQLVRWEEPERALEVMADLPERCGIQKVRGRAYLAAGRPAESAEAWSTALDLCGGSDPSIRRDLGWARLAAGDERGEALLLQSLEQTPDDPAIRHMLARWYRDQRRFNALQEQYEALEALGELKDRERRDLKRLREGMPLQTEQD